MITYKIFQDHIEMTSSTTDAMYTSNDDSSFIFQTLSNDFYKLSSFHFYGREYCSLSQLVELLRLSTLGMDVKCAMLRNLVLSFNISSNPIFEIKIV